MEKNESARRIHKRTHDWTGLHRGSKFNPVLLCKFLMSPNFLPKKRVRSGDKSNFHVSVNHDKETRRCFELVIRTFDHLPLMEGKEFHFGHFWALCFKNIFIFERKLHNSLKSSLIFFF